MDKNKHFKEFFVCPECGHPLCELSKLKYYTDDYCTDCGTKITSARDEAIVLVKEED